LNQFARWTHSLLTRTRQADVQSGALSQPFALTKEADNPQATRNNHP
jgi:hypothetical protein